MVKMNGCNHGQKNLRYTPEKYLLGTEKDPLVKHGVLKRQFEVIHSFEMEMEEFGKREDTRGLPVDPVYENHRI